MIELTKLNGQPFVLNGLYIEQIQSLPDTTITLTNGKILVVQESKAIVVEKTKAFLQNISILAITGEKSDPYV